MASRSDHDSLHADIIEFVPRQLLRRDVRALLLAMQHDEGLGEVRRLIAAACTKYGSALPRELGRVIDRGSHLSALDAILILLIIADEPAQAILWGIAKDEARHPALRLEALRGLYQQGHDIPLAQLVELANRAERSTRLLDRDMP